VKWTKLRFIMYNKTRHRVRRHSPIISYYGTIYDVDRKRVFPVNEFPTMISSGYYGPLWGIILLLYDEANDNNFFQSHRDWFLLARKRIISIENLSPTVP